mmetsp:Transcript_12144/g.33656  ORF Transcript_12144/g.33656 Transcript_12144/m.33656 type:complete len:839 (-) Transcript_12144:72-2588(-)|eukprot:CAMPEP_0168735194 /NCGR_PEP_ID=MMETSP0724-20121128/9204_1 /TAXON_ID=265536 /ORGANISM="Amphiprora sp., Strain CCMP467" /LENGTH=838 /DNA_ID=CAMNT_0008782323 /DNA_START=293 /DNA_END=2809 /DNA_ORIENTATION=+
MQTAEEATSTPPTTDKPIMDPSAPTDAGLNYDKEKSSCTPDTPPGATASNGMTDNNNATTTAPAELPPAPPVPSNVNTRPSSRGRTGSGSRRRANSNDVPRTVQGGSPMQGPYGSGPPPSYPYGGYPPSPYGQESPMMPVGYGQPPPPPMVGGEGRPLMSSGGSVGGHRRSNSNGSVGSVGYGSVVSGMAPPSPRGAPASPRANISGNATADFSPRNEFLNVTGFRPESPRLQQASPRYKHSPTGNGGGMSQMPPPPMIGSHSPYTNGSPMMQQYSPHVMNAAAAMGAGNNMMMAPPMLATSGSYQQEDSLATSSVGGGGGEAVFLARQKSTRTAESSRRRHMRQQSAQLYMESIKGQDQPVMCRDVVFLLIFVFHLLGMAFLFTTYSPEAFAYHDPVEDSVTIYYKNLLLVACFTGVFGITLSTLLLGIMSFFARKFVQIALMVVIGLSFIWGTVGIGLSPKNIVPITGIIALALSVAYAIIVWDRIPFAAANLVTALSAIRAFPGTILVALFFQLLGCAWCIYYGVIVIGVYDSIQDGRIVLSTRWTIFAYVTLAVSFYWTYQVLLNFVQVATAGVIGSWWSQPDGEHTVKKSSFKTIFYSMGSVCLGSLFVGPVRVIRQIAVLFRPSDDASLLCLHECLQCFRTCVTSGVEGLAARFNPWAFTYVGLHGYGFMEAGQMATELFEKRGWTTIVSDDLVPNVLLMTSLVVGGVTGCFGYMLTDFESFHITSVNEPHLVSFVIGIVTGLVSTSILFGAISSSVNAVIVCFATSPVDFEHSHPELSRNMREAWRSVWPGALDVVDMRLAMAEAASGAPPTPNSFNGKGVIGDPTMAPLL